MDGVISGPDKHLLENSFNYPYGTSEQFPSMQDSNLGLLTNSAHYYMECSNKGTCDRATGECQCYDGYDGVACQRASCPGYPNSCSGHGVCKSIRQLAAADNGNIYRLWDQDSTMGCECDAGYSGPDCSLRECKHGVDPLYLDDIATVKFSTWDFATLTTATTATFTDGQSESGTGYWAIRYYDSFGEDWLTTPIMAGATCAEVVDALEALPNNVIPSGQTWCTRDSQVNTKETHFNVWDAQHPSTSTHPYKINYNMTLWEAETPLLEAEISPYTSITTYSTSYSNPSTKVSGYIYRIKFYGNPGKLREPEIEIYLDGKRPSLVSAGYKVITKVWTDGQQGEDNDYFADHCDGVTVTIGNNGNNHFLSGFTSTEKNLLKKCLGSSDFDTSNNVEVYNWDYGDILYPHIVKLVRTVTTYTDGGYYAVLYYDSSATYDNMGAGGAFMLLNPFTPPDLFTTDNYEVYTTKGTLALTSNHSEVTFGFGSKYIYPVNSTYDIVKGKTGYTAPFDGDISCEVGDNNAYKFEYIFHCLNKSDIFTVLNWEYPQYNPPHINLYTAERLVHIDLQYNSTTRFGSTAWGHGAHFMTHVITSDISTNWAQAISATPQFRVYKFFPSTSSTYNYVAECSNRGICDNSAGVCSCFPGYTSDACSEQSSLAV